MFRIHDHTRTEDNYRHSTFLPMIDCIIQDMNDGLVNMLYFHTLFVEHCNAFVLQQIRLFITLCLSHVCHVQS